MVFQRVYESPFVVGRKNGNDEIVFLDLFREKPSNTLECMVYIYLRHAFSPPHRKKILDDGIIKI